MPIYAALIYSRGPRLVRPRAGRDVGKQYAEFGEDAGRPHPGRRRAVPDRRPPPRCGSQGGRGGEVVTSDGPYAETKEVLGGFYLLECADLDEAIARGRRDPGGLGRRPSRCAPSSRCEPATRRHGRLAEVVRVEGGRILAVLARTIGDLAAGRGRRAGRRGVGASRCGAGPGRPADPAAWLYVAARRKALDVLRREADRPRREREAVALAGQLAPELPAAGGRAGRPAAAAVHLLPPRASSSTPGWPSPCATLCGLSTAEVARVLLVAEPTMSKRLTRAKQKIAVARIPFRVPGRRRAARAGGRRRAR